MSTATGRVLTSDPTYASGKAAEFRLDAAGRLMTTSNVTVISEGTGTTIDDATDASVTTTAADILAADSTRRSAVIKSLNTNTAAVRIGKLASVSSTRGHRLQPGEGVVLDTTAAIAAVSESGTQTVSLMLLKD